MKSEADGKYVNELQNKIKEMRNPIIQFDQINEQAIKYKEKLGQLYQLGFIDSERKVKENKNKCSGWKTFDSNNLNTFVSDK